MDLDHYLKTRKAQVDETLDALLADRDGPAATVVAAMRYAVRAGGKRLRPVLALAAGEACGAPLASLLRPACALELVHTYSLIHDDLPAMDDDEMRRGQPTVHRAFGEAEAILAGDALQSLAFEVLATYPEGEAHAAGRAEAVRVVAHCAGIDGMVGGQVADLEAERAVVDAEGLDWIHRHKTGALLTASALLGAIHSPAGPAAREALGTYGRNLGLAFQITDDILDRTSTADALGKTPGKDQRAGKATYPRLYGLEESRRRAAELIERALDALRSRGLLSEPLSALARYAVTRDR
ncbi:MAG TPA: farnesyl diphosphate synthase [Candidatus Polarisedimenticolaceae bacterium]|nr:farnesyl diphosphate synthase [Candidatus Polarisedimenticolaceae bacterium]